MLAVALALGEVGVQVRKTYVSLLTPRRTFAAVQATTRTRVDLGLRLPDPPLGGRLLPPGSVGQSAVTARIALASVADVDDEVAGWLRRAYVANA